jgi:hypothetical protein
MQPLAVSRGVRRSEPELPQPGALNSVASAVKRPYVSIPPREVRCRAQPPRAISYSNQKWYSLCTPKIVATFFRVSPYYSARFSDDPVSTGRA